MGPVDLMFVAQNRAEYTRKTLETLYANTSLSLLRTFTVYDDMSTDGTSEFLSEFCKRKGLGYVRKTYNSIVLVMREAIAAGRAKYLAKIDNDTMAPRPWLDVCVEQMEANPQIDLLGVEAMFGCEADPKAKRRCQPATHIGGIGLFRRDAFERCGLPDVQAQRYFGFTEWQHNHTEEITPAWLIPALPVCLLDHVPLEPWRGLKADYVAKGWQRQGWGEYPPSRSALWEWWA